jgi:hypothetical protein
MHIWRRCSFSLRFILAFIQASVQSALSHFDLGFWSRLTATVKRFYHAFAWMVFSVLAPLQRYVGLAVAVTAKW